MINKQLFYFAALLLVFSCGAMEKAERETQFPVLPKKEEEMLLERLYKDGWIPDKNVPLLPIPLALAAKSTEYWRAFKNEPQEKKDRILRTMVKGIFDCGQFGNKGYYIGRFFIVAAIGGGAKPKSGIKFLSGVLEINDIELVEFLLHHKMVNLSQLDYYLYEARTVAVAELLLKAGANLLFRGFGGNTLLHQNVLFDKYEPDLVRMCRSGGLSPFDCHSEPYYKFGSKGEWIDTRPVYTGNTALHLLINKEYGENICAILQKCCYLFYGLSPVQTIDLCNVKNCQNKTPLDVLKSRSDAPRPNVLLSLLEDKINCAIAQEARAILLGKRERGQARVPAVNRSIDRTRHERVLEWLRQNAIEKKDKHDDSHSSLSRDASF